MATIFLFQVLVQPLYANGLISKVELENVELNLSQDRPAAITYSLEEPCRANVFITDVRGNIVRNIITKEDLSGGEHLEIWDGQDNFGNPVGNGVYFPIIQCTSKRKGTFIYNPSSNPWGAQTEAENIHYDSELQLLTFELGAMAYGRLRVGLKEGGPVYKTLAPWKSWQPGRYQIQWDGKDVQGYQWVIDQEKLSYSFDAFSLPTNAIIVTGSDKAELLTEPKYSVFPVHPPSAQPTSFFALEAGSQGGEPELSVTWVDSKGKGDRTILKGNALTTVNFAEPTKRSSTLKSGSELILYVDDRYVVEKPIDGFPAMIGFNTRDFANGSHTVTINLLTTDDRAGISIHKIEIDND